METSPSESPLPPLTISSSVQVLTLTSPNENPLKDHPSSSPILPRKRPRHETSWTKAHFTKKEDRNGLRKFCKYCDKNYISTTSTHNLARHLKVSHGIDKLPTTTITITENQQQQSNSEEILRKNQISVNLISNPFSNFSHLLEHCLALNSECLELFSRLNNVAEIKEKNLIIQRVKKIKFFHLESDRFILRFEGGKTIKEVDNLAQCFSDFENIFRSQIPQYEYFDMKSEIILSKQLKEEKGMVFLEKMKESLDKIIEILKIKISTILEYLSIGQRALQNMISLIDEKDRGKVDSVVFKLKAQKSLKLKVEFEIELDQEKATEEVEEMKSLILKYFEREDLSKEEEIVVEQWSFENQFSNSNIIVNSNNTEFEDPKDGNTHFLFGNKEMSVGIHKWKIRIDKITRGSIYSTGIGIAPSNQTKSEWPSGSAYISLSNDRLENMSRISTTTTTTTTLSSDKLLGNELTCTLDFDFNKFTVGDENGKVIENIKEFKIDGQKFKPFIFMYFGGLSKCTVLQSYSIIHQRKRKQQQQQNQHHQHQLRQQQYHHQLQHHHQLCQQQQQLQQQNQQIQQNQHQTQPNQQQTQPNHHQVQPNQQQFQQHQKNQQQQQQQQQHTAHKITSTPTSTHTSNFLPSISIPILPILTNHITPTPNNTTSISKISNITIPSIHSTFPTVHTSLQSTNSNSTSSTPDSPITPTSPTSPTSPTPTSPSPSPTPTSPSPTPTSPTPTPPTPTSPTPTPPTPTSPTPTSPIPTPPTPTIPNSPTSTTTTTTF